MNTKTDENTKTKVVMFVDITNYSKKTSNISKQDLIELHDIFDGFCIPNFEAFTGRIIKKIGDAFLVTFENPTDAVMCGIELQKSFHNHNKKIRRTRPKNQIRVRVALHMGEVTYRKGDIYGDTVNTTARLEALCKPGQVVFSGSVYSAMERNGIGIVHLGLRKLKGMKYPVQAFRIRTKVDDRIIKIKKRKKSYTKFKQRISASILLLISLIAGAASVAIILYYLFSTVL